MGLIESMIKRDEVEREQLILSKSIEETLSKEDVLIGGLPEVLFDENLKFHSRGMINSHEPTRAMFWINNKAGIVPDLKKEAVEKMIQILDGMKNGSIQNNLSEKKIDILLEQYNKALVDFSSLGGSFEQK